ncbi:prepilin peptidase [Salicibibacter kimchii]|uniref:Prepilin peptidase n=1 Tax=Salicibibacter kimchii TaxID=2099786 RepID=A0A345BXV9_9BACI|nr:A24 family peptidase [Salicibibacter kimchii]AXF55790.1 prepilin peptidase [Salicibibacter kimchii]
MLPEVMVMLMLGLIFGSFFQVVGVRVPIGKPIAWSRSECPNCHATLQARDLFPVVSFLSTLGRCRYCTVHISPQYFIVEIATAFLFVLVYVRFYPLSTEMVIALLVLSLVIIVTITDLRYMRIPNVILLLFATLFVFIRLFIDPLDPWWSSFLAASTSFVILYCVLLLSGGGIGGGDVKFFAVLGLAFGLWDLLLVFFLSTLFGTVIGLLALVSGRLKTGQAFPFAPSIALAVVIVLLFGNTVWSWYPLP